MSLTKSSNRYCESCGPGAASGWYCTQKAGTIAVAEAFQRLVVQVHVRQFDVVGVERIRVHREAVVVRGDLDLVGDLVQHRMIGAAVAELQLVGLAAERQAQDLVPQADAEDRDLARAACAPAPPGTASGSGSPGPLERNTPSGFSASTSSAVVTAGTTRHAAAHVHQPAENVALDAEVVGHHVEPRLGRRRRRARRASRRRRPRSTRSARAWRRAWPGPARPWMGLLRAFSTSSRGSPPAVESTPRMTPRVRRCRTRRRVSISAMTGMLCAPRNSSACSFERQLLAIEENSRTTRPSM